MGATMGARHARLSVANRTTPTPQMLHLTPPLAQGKVAQQLLQG